MPRVPPLPAFFFFTFALSWSCFLALAIFFPDPDSAPVASRAILLLGTFAPSFVATILLGPGGLGQLTWSFSLRWAVFAIAFMPVVKFAVALLHRALTGAWPPFTGESPWIIVAAIVISTPFQAGEEIGWRGFALPRMAARLGYGPAAILLGLIWGLWHLPLFFVRGEYYGQSFPMFALGTTALSVAIAFVYVRTGGSVLMTMLMHSAVNQTVGIVSDASPAPGPAFSLAAPLPFYLTVALLWISALWFLFRLRPAAAVNPL